MITLITPYIFGFFRMVLCWSCAEALSKVSRAKMITELLTWSKALLIILALASNYVCANYVVDDSVGLGRMFNGIGGLSGGGVSDTIYANNFCQFILSAVIYIYLINSLWKIFTKFPSAQALIPSFAYRQHHACWSAIQNPTVVKYWIICFL